MEFFLDFCFNWKMVARQHSVHNFNTSMKQVGMIPMERRNEMIEFSTDEARPF